jgi:uncharacterized protein (TIGR03118 family)
MQSISRLAGRAAAFAAFSSLCCSLPLVTPAAAKDANAYTVRNLVTDGGQGSIAAEHADPLLVNAWGVAFNPKGFVWVTDNGSGASTLYDGNGVKNALEVSIPNGAPTGITFNTTQDFAVTNGTTSAVAPFIFVTENGIVAGWSPGVDLHHAIAMADNSQTTGAIYKGVAIASNGTANFIFATDFHNGRIDVFDRNFMPVTLAAGAFTDARLPSGFAPFGIANIGGKLYVTYAKQDDAREDDVKGPGLGFVDVFDAAGKLLARLVRRGHLDAPWGLALAPANFGRFSNTLLVGNFGDGTIHAYDPASGKYRGTLKTAEHRQIVIDGLWGMAFGNDLLDQPSNTLFAAAGPNDEQNGLYVRIDVDTSAKGGDDDEEDDGDGGGGTQ